MFILMSHSIPSNAMLITIFDLILQCLPLYTFTTNNIIFQCANIPTEYDSMRECVCVCVCSLHKMEPANQLSIYWVTTCTWLAFAVRIEPYWKCCVDMWNTLIPLISLNYMLQHKSGYVHVLNKFVVAPKITNINVWLRLPVWFIY